MDLVTALKTGKKLAEYFVYCCGEGENYVALVEKIREATVRSSLLTAVDLLLHYGEAHLKQEIQDANQQELDELSHFLRSANINEVRQFHAALITNISAFELEKIREQERYLRQFLS